MTLTSRTRRRIDMLAELLGEFATRDLTVTQAADFLQYSHNGAKNYLRELCAAGLIAAGGTRAQHAGPPAPVFHLVAGQPEITQFIAAVQFTKAPPREPAQSRVLLSQALADPARHLHIANGDAKFIPRLHCLDPFRDGLVSALFGPAQGVLA